MDTVHNNRLKKEVRKLLKEREEFAIVSKKRKTLLRTIAILTMWGVGFTIGYGIYTFRSTSSTRLIDAIYIWLWAFSILCSGLFFYLLSFSPPRDSKKLDIWFLWRGRASIALGVGIYIVQVVNQMLPTEVNYFGDNRYVIVMGYSCMAIFLLVLTAVISRPELFLAERLTGFASGCFTFGLVTSPVRLLTVLPLQSQHAWLISALLLFIVILPTFGRSKNLKRLNFVQVTAISMISPPKLLQALRTHDEIIRDQYQALIVKRGLEKDLSLGAQKELARMFVEDRKKDNEVLKWIVPTAIFFITVLADSLISDLFYEDVLKPFICGFIRAVCD